MSEIEIQKTRENGISIYTQCNSFFTSIRDFFKTLKLFFGCFTKSPKIPIFGSKVPSYMRNATIDFI